MSFVEIINLTKSFRPTLRLRHLLSWPRGGPIKVLDSVTFQVTRGEIFGLIGPNGTGKSTLLRIMATLILPDTGSVRINEIDIIHASEKAKEFIGLVSGEERSLYWRLSARQNLEFFSPFYNITRHEARQRINELFTLLEITAPEQRLAEYSTGMRHRLNLARGLLHNPPLLLLDEPTKSLDPTSAQKLRRFIKEELVHRQRKTIILATHNLAEAEELCDRVGIISQGRLRLCGTISELRQMVKAPPETDLEEIYQRAMCNYDLLIMNDE